MIVAVFRNQENAYLFEYAYSTGNKVQGSYPSIMYI